MRWRNVLIILLAAVAVGGWWSAWRGRADRAPRNAFDAQRLAFLERENTRLVRQLAQTQTDQEHAADLAARAEIEREVATLRELPFVNRITYREIPRAELPTILRQKLNQQLPDREFDNQGVALTALGLLPPGTDLRRTYLALLGEQVGAFYDQHTREVFTFSGQPLSAAQNRVILAHELTHALEDQHFHLERLPLETKGNDDRAMAASALVEGDATLVMNRYMVGHVSGAMLKDSLASAFTTDVRQLASAPRFLRESLVFPYLKGQVFCETLQARGGWTALAEAFRNPPSSTAQIFHPERYLATPRWEPEAVEFATKAVNGQEPVADNVAGEFGVRQILKVWLKGEGNDDVAAGWTGDRFLVYGDSQTNGYLWHTVWASPEAAERFAAAAGKGWETRYGIKADEPTNSAPENTIPTTNGRSARLPNGREVRITREGRTVTLIEAQDVAWMESLNRLRPPVAAAPRNP